MLPNKEDIEDVCISALKEKDIEAKLKMVTADWTLEELNFQTFKNRGELMLRGDTTAETVGKAEDSLMVLGSLLSNRSSLCMIDLYNGVLQIQRPVQSGHSEVGQ